MWPCGTCQDLTAVRANVVRDVTRYGLVGRSTAFIVTVEARPLQYGNGI